MPSAQSLEDLLGIRAANRNLIDSINGNLGSALGFKKATDQAISDEPAVLIFVPRKIDNNWLPADQRIPKKLTGPGGLECPTDVVEGGKYDQIFLQETDITGTTDLGVREWRDLLGGAPLSEENLNLLEILHGWSEKMVPGSRVAGLDAQGGGYTGTAGCFVRDRETQNLGILTNHHVADRRGNVLMYPWFNGPNAAVVTKLREYVRDEHRFPGVVGQPEEYYRIDCAFAALTPALVIEIDFEAP